MAPDHWRLMLEGPQDGAWNMAVDRALLQAWESGPAVPTLRLYGWSRPTVSVGYAQNVERDVDVDRCREEGVPIVKRPTGGRALLHHREVTYTLVAPLDHPAFGAGLRGTFETISRLLIAGLTGWGVPSAWLHATNGGRGQLGSVRSPACFAALNHGEITVRGKKLIGSAQRRTHHAFLQHGSVILEQAVEQFTCLCRYPSEEARREDTERLRKSSVSLMAVADRAVDYDSVAQALVQGFRHGLGGDWQEGALTPGEVELRDAFLTRS